MNTAGSPSTPQPWSEVATVVVAGLLGLCAAFMALLVLLADDSADTPTVSEVSESRSSHVL